MGSSESRVESSDDAFNLHDQEEMKGEPSATISITPELTQQLNGSAPAAEASASHLTNEQMKEQMQAAYRKGVQDAKAHYANANKHGGNASSAEQAKRSEQAESARVEELVQELNSKHYRAPLRDVQCSSERDACLECYRSEGNVLKCKEVADAFTQCARRSTEKFVQA